MLSTDLACGIPLNRIQDPGHVRQDTDSSVVDPLACGSRWDPLVLGHPEASVFHTSAWIRVLCQTYGYRPFCIVREGVQPALFPAVEVDSFITGRRGICLPFTDSCSPLTAGEHDFKELWNSALEVGRNRRWRTLELRDCDERSGFTPSLRFYSHGLSLAAGSSTIFG